MSNQWHYSQDGAQYGPVDESEIVRLIQDGELPPSTPVCKEGGMDWQSAREHACFKVEIYPRKKTSTKAAASGETPQPARQAGAQPVIATSSPAGSFAPTVTNPVLAPGASGKSSMSGATILCLVIMLIITIGSVCFSFVKSQEDEDLINAFLKAKREAAEAHGKVTKLEANIQHLKNKFAYADSVAKASKAQYDQLASNVAKGDAEIAGLQQENSTLNAEKQSWATERQNLQTKANEATIAQVKLAAMEAEVLALQAQLNNLPGKKKNTGEVVTILRHNPALEYYVINAGSDNGINNGDKFTIFRAGKALGKIEIARTQPTVSIAVYQKGFPKPPAPFKAGDKVMKIK